jgi:hypothetical protein
MVSRPRRNRRGRPLGTVVPIERDRQRFEIAAWWAFVEMGCGPFDAARRALLAVKGGRITIEDIEGVLQLASAEIPLPQPYNPEDKDKGLRRLAAKARRQPPAEWLTQSSAHVQALVIFTAKGNIAGICAALDNLLRLGWRPVIDGLAERIKAAFGSNLPPADVERLSPAVRRFLAEKTWFELIDTFGRRGVRGIRSR